MKCSVSFCDRDALIKGLCNTHRVQQRSGYAFTPIRSWGNKKKTKRVIKGDLRMPLTTFPKLKAVHIGPQGTDTVPNSPSRGCNAITEAVNRTGRSYQIHLHRSRAEAVRQAQVVVAIGPVKRSFGKPTLSLPGELSPSRYSDKIRRFLKQTGATSVAFALTSNQSYWGIHKTIYRAFDWNRRDYTSLHDDDRQEIRRLYEVEGWTVREIADKFGVSQPAITYVTTGYPDGARFKGLRKRGYRTINSIATETGSVFGEAVLKAQQLGISLNRVGPMLTLINRKDSRRLKEAMQRRVVAKAKRKVEREEQGLSAYSRQPDPDMPGWSQKVAKLNISGNKRNKKGENRV